MILIQDMGETNQYLSMQGSFRVWARPMRGGVAHTPDNPDPWHEQAWNQLLDMVGELTRLTYWDRVTHTFFKTWDTIALGNGLSHAQCQAIGALGNVGKI